MNDPALADAILDRVLHAAHKVTLAGESLRKQWAQRRLFSKWLQELGWWIAYA